MTYILLAVIANIGFALAQESVSGGISGDLIVSGCIVDNDNNFDQITPTVTINYSIVRGTTAPSGTGNMVLADDTIIGETLVTPLSDDAYYLSNLSPLLNAGATSTPGYVPEKDINGNVRVYNGRVDIGAIEYSLIFNQGNGNWSTPGNWHIGRIPDEYDLVTIHDTVTVNNNSAVCKSIIEISDTGQVIIETASQLEVKNTINNLNANKILVKASTTSSNGTLIFNNPAELPLYATVQMYSKANIQIVNEDTTYRWQYFGIPLRSVVATASFYGSWIRKWNESSIEFSKWEQLGTFDLLHSFSGYEITQYNEKFLTFKGVLENSDTTIVLNKSDVPYYAGQHILSNPYTAAINISDLTFGPNTEATVYVYNTGSYEEWNQDNSNGRIGDGPGQYTAVPQNVAPLVYPAIPSMQGFLIKATNNPGTITIPYASKTQNLVLQKAKSTKKNNYLTVNINSQHHLDRVWLVHEPSAGKEFDNGWDGYKITSNSKQSAFIYAKETAGNLQVNSISDFNNINLYFKAGKDSQYEMTVVNHNLQENFSSIYLIDMKENRAIKIEDDTTSYVFTAYNTNAEENRFRIITDKSFNLDPVDGKLISIYQNDNQREINIYNFTGQAGNYMMYDISGRLILHQQLLPGLNSIPSGQYSGIVIIKALAGSISTTEKMIIVN
jgi:hypothetical protein